jgi:hypothetical protein
MREQQLMAEVLRTLQSLADGESIREVEIALGPGGRPGRWGAGLGNADRRHTFGGRACCLGAGFGSAALRGLRSRVHRRPPGILSLLRWRRSGHRTHRPGEPGALGGGRGVSQRHGWDVLLYCDSSKKRTIGSCPKAPSSGSTITPEKG